MRSKSTPGVMSVSMAKISSPRLAPSLSVLEQAAPSNAERSAKTPILRFIPGRPKSGTIALVSTQILTHASDGPGAKHKGVALKVVVVGGPDEGAEAPLDGPCDLGSDPECRLVLTDPSVSRKHLVVSVTGGRIMVK